MGNRKAIDNTVSRYLYSLFLAFPIIMSLASHSALADPKSQALTLLRLSLQCPRAEDSAVDEGGSGIVAHVETNYVGDSTIYRTEERHIRIVDFLPGKRATNTFITTFRYSDISRVALRNQDMRFIDLLCKSNSDCINIVYSNDIGNRYGRNELRNSWYIEACDAKTASAIMTALRILMNK